MYWSSRRLHSGDEFRAVTRGGARSARSHVVVHLTLLPQGTGAPRVGFVVSKKVGNSVIRHRVARRFREIVRQNLEQFPAGSTTVLRALPGIQDVPFADLEGQVLGGVGSAAAKLERRRAAASGGGAR